MKRIVNEMDKLAAEKEAKKYRRFFEECTVMPFAYKARTNTWMLVEYKRPTNKEQASGFAIFPEEQMTPEEKEEIMSHFASVFGGLLRIRKNILHRIRVTEEITRTLERMNQLLSDWADEEEKGKLVYDFKQFSNFVLWCQKEKNDKFQLTQQIEQKLFKTYSFTAEDRQCLTEVMPHFDVIVYLQMKRQEEQLESNRNLLKAFRKDKGNLSKEDAFYVEEILDTYCNKEAERTLSQVLEKEFMPSWRELPGSIDSYKELLESSKEQYSKREEEDLAFNISVLRN